MTWNYFCVDLEKLAKEYLTPKELKCDDLKNVLCSIQKSKTNGKNLNNNQTKLIHNFFVFD